MASPRPCDRLQTGARGALARPLVWVGVVVAVLVSASTSSASVRADTVGSTIWSYTNGHLVARQTATSDFDTSKPTFIITHGWNGLYTGGKLDPSYVKLANSILEDYKGANVLFIDWSRDSTALLPMTAASHINNDADVAYDKLRSETPLGSDPGLWQSVTMIGSSFGAYFNESVAAREYSDNRARVNTSVMLDPANTFGLLGSGYTLDDQEIQTVFQRSISIRTGSFADDQDPLGDTSYFAEPPFSATLKPISAHGWGRTLLANALAKGDKRILTDTLPRGLARDEDGFVMDDILAPDGSVVSAATAIDFSGTWTGSYSGVVLGKDGCGETPISGAVTLSLSQSGTSLSGTMTLAGSSVRVDQTCEVIGRSNEDISINGAAVSGMIAAGGGLTLIMNAGLGSLDGSFQGNGHVTFSDVTRIKTTGP